MRYKIGDKVKIVSVVKSKSKELYNKNKESCIGRIGTIYGSHVAYNIDTYDSSLPNGVEVYSIKDENGRDISPYIWFGNELVKIE